MGQPTWSLMHMISPEGEHRGVSTVAWREQPVAEIARELVPDGFERPKQADTWRFGSPDRGAANR